MINHILIPRRTHAHAFKASFEHGIHCWARVEPDAAVSRHACRHRHCHKLLGRRWFTRIASPCASPLLLSRFLSNTLLTREHWLHLMPPTLGCWLLLA